MTNTQRIIVLMTLLCVLMFCAGGLEAQTFTPISTGPPVTELGAWRSVAWIDYDRDGDLDLYVTRGKAGGQDNVLFRNDGPPNYTFTRMSGLSISQDHEPSDGSSWADYDNDGFPDCFTANWYNVTNQLYHNNGNGTFTRIVSGPVYNDRGYSETGSWGDYNNDGLVDLYVANSAGTRLNFLYKNLGGGQFLRISTGPPATDAKTSRGVNWVDYDDDGDLDLFVTNENGENESLYKNMLTETGVDTFARVTTGPLVTSGGSSWSGSWGDFDNDGDQDVFVANQAGEHSALFLNNGGGNFAKDSTDPVTTDSGFAATGAWADIDNDGDLDLIVTHAYSGSFLLNYLYRNMLIETDTARFERIFSGPVVTDQGYMYGLSWGDFDEDGDLDLVVARTVSENQTNAFYRNDGNSNHWLSLDLRGTQSNAAAIGAKIRVKATIAGRQVWQLRVVEGQSGYCGQNLQAHLGLGDAGLIDSLRIEWPSGNHETFVNVVPDRHLIVVENDSTPVLQVEPPNGYLNHAVDVILRWSRSLYYAPYRLQVGTDSTFSSGIVLDSIVTPDTLAHLNIQQNTIKYYWRVRSARSIHTDRWSEVRSFDNDITPPGVPVHLSPPEVAENVPLTTPVRWAKTPNATLYHFQLGTDSVLSAVVVDTMVVDTTCAVGPLAYLTKYYWTVKGQNFIGTSAAGPSSAFTTIIQAPDVPALATPNDMSIDQSFDVVLSWMATARASSYQAQVSFDSTFAAILVNDSTIASTTRLITGLRSLTTYYWHVRGSNVGGKSPYSATRRFMTKLANPVLFSPPDAAEQTTEVTFQWSRSEHALEYHLQISKDSQFVMMESEDSTIVDTILTRTVVEHNRDYYWRVRGRNGLRRSEWTDGRRFRTSFTVHTVHVESPWTLVSVSPTVRDPKKSELFPTSLSPAYAYVPSGGYVVAESLQNGVGYWMKFSSPQDIRILGIERGEDTIDVLVGWNLVGTVTTPVAAGQVMSIPPGLATSDFYEFAGAYRRADSLLPGQGYWVYAQQGGKLVFSAATTIASDNRIRIVRTSETPPNPPGTPISDIQSPIPHEFLLAQNYPNPFNPSTVIRYDLPISGLVTIRMFDILGRLVTTLVDNLQSSGFKQITWDGTRQPSGIYLCRMKVRSADGARSALFEGSIAMLLVK